MAGWKLRKDKTQPESPDAEPGTTAEPATLEHGAAIYSVPEAGLESSAEEGHGLGLEAGDHLRFEDENGPLKLMDYSAPFTEDLLPLSGTPIIAAPPEDTLPEDMLPGHTPLDDTPPVEAPPAGMPTLTTPSFDTSTAEPGEDAADFTSTLRMSREELAAAFAPPTPTGIPIVAPFVLDAPLVAPATVATPPRLVVRMGRLSAAFDITKEVTVIGRPDSEMHYYPDVEIDLDDAVSRRHAEIIRRDGAYSIVDTGSTNGTLLNGETLPAHDERPLTHGDRIRVGERTEIIFE